MTKSWNEQQGRIYDFYIVQRRPLHEVQPLMIEKYGFRASIRAYKEKIKEWGYNKNRPRVRHESCSDIQRSKLGISTASFNPVSDSPVLSSNVLHLALESPSPLTFSSAPPPTLAGPLPSNTEVNISPSSWTFEQQSQCPEYPPIGNPNFDPPTAIESNDHVEEIIHQADPVGSLGGTWSTRDSLIPINDVFKKPVPRGPILGPGSQEMLVMRFNKQTCGILSVKDGLSENPWRTLVWPLAKESTPLCHAILAITAFHNAKDIPQLWISGLDHARRSLRTLAQGIRNMRIDVALATTLVLVFSESWNLHISTGIQHLRGAKALLRKVIALQQWARIRGDDLARLRFLYNTWTYMDVISRLTLLEGTGFGEITPPPFHTQHPSIPEVDPLLVVQRHFPP